jgi:KUP system potassium uptake protein
MADSIEPTAAAPPVGPGASALVLGAIGVVFGDIGTSPLYTLQECLHSRHGVAPRPENVLGVVSLIVWSVTMVVTVKYLGFMMRDHFLIPIEQVVEVGIQLDL